MSDRLPIFIGPLNFADRRRVLTGDLDLSNFSRLANMPGNKQSTVVTIALSFYKLGRTPALDGELSTILELQCQNCLKPINVTVFSQFKLGFISSLVEADLLPEGYEPFLLESDEIALVDVVEEELLLAFPAFPKHKEECIDTSYQINNRVHQNTQSETDNPFSVLAKLKNTGD